MHRVVRRPRTRAAGVGEIAYDLVQGELVTPGLEEVEERRLAGLIAPERILEIGLLVEIGVRVGEDDQLAAAHDELVDRVFGVFHHVARMDDDAAASPVPLGTNDLHAPVEREAISHPQSPAAPRPSPVRGPR